METRILGKTTGGLAVSEIGLGRMGMSLSYGTLLPKTEGIAPLRSADDRVAIVGERYPEAAPRMIDR